MKKHKIVIIPTEVKFNSKDYEVLLEKIDAVEQDLENTKKLMSELTRCSEYLVKQLQDSLYLKDFSTEVFSSCSYRTYIDKGFPTDKPVLHFKGLPLQ